MNARLVNSGRAQAVIAASIGALAFTKDSRIRLLGVTSPKRSKYLPDLPTIAQSGLPGYQFDSWFGLLGPAAVPAEQANRIHAAIRKLLKDPVIEVEVDPISRTPYCSCRRSPRCPIPNRLTRRNFESKWSSRFELAANPAS
jgi:tripartite-type tricarboxylate transporter receptor subunit TctC